MPAHACSKATGSGPDIRGLASPEVDVPALLRTLSRPAAGCPEQSMQVRAGNGSWVDSDPVRAHVRGLLAPPEIFRAAIALSPAPDARTRTLHSREQVRRTPVQLAATRHGQAPHWQMR